MTNLSDEQKMKTKNTNDELPSYPKHFVSRSCGGERCYCGNDATHKVGEEIPHDEKDSYPEPLKGLSIRHNFTQYVCCQCFTNIMGNAVFCDNTRPAKIERDVAAETADLNAKPDDADRRAGMAERLRAYDRDALNKNNDWRDRNKERLGFDRNISFDVVWQAVIDALGGYEKAKAILSDDKAGE